ncbi:Heterokaryon incompatibility [Colletotrichum asianum]
MSLITIDAFSECEICSDIWSRLCDSSDNAQRTSINLGSFEEALRSNCKRHKPIVEWFKMFCDEPGQTIRPAKTSKDVGIHRHRPGVLTLTESIQNLGRCAELCLIRKDSVKNHPGITRRLDPKWVDLSVVSHWLEQCVSSHGAKCENPMKIWPYRPAWVVDTKAKCLVPGDKCASFIALSYRWGKAPGLHIQPDTMSNLQRPNSLDDPAIATQLAPMVRQAIALTSSVGQRYLWVDTLSIDHSRIAESTTQLQNMGAIYANASLTIVALDRDAEDGFPGLRDISREKDRDDEGLIQFGNEQFISDKLNYFGLTSWSMYHERAWTFQEFNMSPRRLIFSKDSLHWMCQCSVWEEHLHHGIEAGKYLNPRVGEIMRGMPNIRSLSNLIGYYNDMKLSYDEDCLPGITGLLTVFSRCFYGGFLCGIPEMFLETALSWRPTWYHTDLQRRIHSDRFDTSRLHPCLLPSWSWIGWEGLVDIRSLEAGPANPKTWKIRETIPITTYTRIRNFIKISKGPCRPARLET